jgi:hypothetical protein
MSQPEIDPAKLFQQAPAVLNQLARISQMVLAAWKDAPVELRLAAGDAVALIARLAKVEVRPDECVVVLEHQRKVPRGMPERQKTGRALQKQTPDTIPGKASVRKPLPDDVQGSTPLSRSPSSIRAKTGPGAAGKPSTGRIP